MLSRLLNLYFTFFLILGSLGTFASKVSIKNIAIEPAKLTDNSACLGAGFILETPLPCASPNLFLNIPSPFTMAEHPPRICLKISSLC